MSSILQHSSASSEASDTFGTDEVTGSNEPACWICLEPSVAPSGLGVLRRGCACRGSTGFVHTGCIVRLAEQRESDLSSWHKCPTCKQDYVGKLQLELAQEFMVWTNKTPRKVSQRLYAADNLALAMYCGGRYAEAADIYRAILRLRLMTLGKQHPDTLNSANNLAGVLVSQGAVKEAVALHEATLLTQLKIYGHSEHPSVMTSAHNLGNALFAIGNFSKAESVYVETLVNRRRVLGRMHPATLSTLNALGCVNSALGRLNIAEAMHRDALAGQCRVLGREHPSSLNTRNALGNTLYCSGRYSEAAHIYCETMHVQTREWGVLHPMSQQSRHNFQLAINRAADLHKHSRSREAGKHRRINDAFTDDL